MQIRKGECKLKQLKPQTLTQVKNTKHSSFCFWLRPHPSLSPTSCWDQVAIQIASIWSVKPRTYPIFRSEDTAPSPWCLVLMSLAFATSRNFALQELRLDLHWIKFTLGFPKQPNNILGDIWKGQMNTERCIKLTEIPICEPICQSVLFTWPPTKIQRKRRMRETMTQLHIDNHKRPFRGGALQG